MNCDGNSGKRQSDKRESNKRESNKRESNKRESEAPADRDPQQLPKDSAGASLSRPAPRNQKATRFTWSNET